MNIGVLTSHEGTTLQAVLDACIDDRIRGAVVLVISNNSGAAAVTRARSAGVTALHLSTQTHPDPVALDEKMLRILTEMGVEVVLLAGYMRKVGSLVRRGFPGRILNTHPALLPEFGGQGMFGRHVHEAVLASGVAESGATVHVIDGDYDTGPILDQRRVPVLSGDTVESLADRVGACEKELVVDVLSQIAAGKLRLGAVAG